MPLRKQQLKDFITHLSEKELRKALKWIDSISEEEIQKLKPPIEVQLAEVLLKRFLQERQLILQKLIERNKE